MRQPRRAPRPDPPDLSALPALPDPPDALVGGGRVDPGSVGRWTPLPVDYADVYTLRRADAHRWDAQTWARAMFGDAPSLAERFIWQVLLQLRLRRDVSPATVAGWPVVECADDLVRLETRSWHLTGTLVVSTEPGSATLVTAVRYDRRAGGLVWPPLSAVHRRLVPGLLGDAYQRLARR